MNVQTLYDAIAEVCPVNWVQVNDPVDRAQWLWEPKQNATQPQIDAGNNVVATIPAEILSTLLISDWIGRFSNAEYRAATAAAWRQTAGNAKNWDVVAFDSAGIVDCNKKKTKTLRDGLVTDGILTAQRADEIFS